MTNLSVPSVHINGTSEKQLVDGYLHAIRAVSLAIEALNETAPHGRDYYIQPDGGALSKARSEYLARLAKLESVKTELEAIAIAVQEQTP